MSDLDPELERLFRAARSEEDPTDDDRRAVRRSLATRVATAAAAGAAATLATRSAAAAGGAALGKATLLGSFAAGLGAGAVVGVAVTVAVVTTGSEKPSEHLNSVSVTAPSHAPSAAPMPRAAAEPTPEPLPSASALVEQTPPRPGEIPSVTPLLQAETRALADVQRALRDGQADEALRLLAEQERRFALGALHEERAASRVIALCAAGRVAEGRRARDRFLSSYPNSPAADRVRASCTP
jgi:hypothetical protein